MKSRPIPFSAPMVRALLDGRKTQARRQVRFRGIPPTDEQARMYGFGDRVCCPYGQPGDELWVRETWTLGRASFSQKAGATFRTRQGATQQVLYRANNLFNDSSHRWRPSIHMSRWASRITLRVTSVHIERLQAISEADAKAEGAGYRISPGGDLAGAFDTCDTPISYRAHFQALWESIYGPGSWAENPWVWVVGFERVEVAP